MGKAAMKALARKLWVLPFALALLPLEVAAAEAASVQPLDRQKISAMDHWQLRREIQRTENRFFALYNTLSTRNEFDILCTMEVLPNSKRKYNSCRPRFLLKAERADAEAFLDGVLFSGANTGSASDRQSVSTGSLQGGGAGAGQRGGNAMLPQSEADARRDEYRKYMLDIINGSPDLLILVRDREALEAALRKAPPEKD
jgi:hypothetical protein